MVGAYAGKILAGTLISDGAFTILPPGEPLGAFVAAYVGIAVGSLISGKTKVDILLTPVTTILCGSAVGIFVGPPISEFMTYLGSLVNWGTQQQPFLMGIVVSVLMGIFLTLPISSAAIGIVLGLNGLAAGAANRRLLRQYDWFCRCKLQGKQDRRAFGAGARHKHASNSEHY